MKWLLLLAVFLTGCVSPSLREPSVVQPVHISIKAPETSESCPLLSMMTSGKGVWGLMGKSKGEILQSYPWVTDSGGTMIDLRFFMRSYGQIDKMVVFQGTRSDPLRVHRVGIVCNPSANLEDTFSFLHSVYGNPEKSDPHRSAAWVSFDHDDGVAVFLDTRINKEGTPIVRVTLWDSLAFVDFSDRDQMWQGKDAL